MQLASFKVSNFRSITEAKKVNLSNYSVLIGANNEGKSNILHALAIGMQAIESFKYLVVRDKKGRIRSTSPTLIGRQSDYRWSRDFPISKQSRSKHDSCTEISFEFQLSENEIQLFKEEIGSKLNGTLPVLVKFFQHSQDILIPKQGPGGTTLNKKTNKVAEFVSKNVNFDYIPAVRTSESAETVITDLLSRELARVEEFEEYKKLVTEIHAMYDPMLKQLSNSITQTVSSFLPSVKAIDIKMPRDARMRALRRGVIIEVNDGNNTPLDQKGDGVKSLVALALMRHASEIAGGSANSIVAIEEPEAHLHPHAIHELRDVLLGLSKKSQVILTSHSPLFVNPAKLASTIVVRESRAAMAASIAQVRDVLGVRLSDNLQSARLVAIVEGDEDVMALKAILQNRYPGLRQAIKNGDLAFDPLGGASNLSYKARMYRNSATLVHCFLDSDVAGHQAIKRAIDQSIIRESDYNLINVEGQKEAEIEDLFDKKKYGPAFRDKFGVDPTVKPPDSKNEKWSGKMGKIFQSHGKLWDDQLKTNVKKWLADFVMENVEDIVIEERFGPVDAFAKSLMKKLEG